MIRWQWHQLDHMQVICTSIQTDNHTSTSSLKFFMGQMLFLPSKQQHQSIEGTTIWKLMTIIKLFICNDERQVLLNSDQKARCWQPELTNICYSMVRSSHMLLLLNGSFPGESGSASWVPSRVLLLTCSRMETLRISGTGFFTSGMSFLLPNHQCLSTEGDEKQ